MLEEKRKKALDMHLNYIVDQTEKYSSWLVKGFTDQTGATSQTVPGPTSGSQESTTTTTSGKLALCVLYVLFLCVCSHVCIHACACARACVCARIV